MSSSTKCVRKLTRGYRVDEAIANGTPVPTCQKNVVLGTTFCKKCIEMHKRHELKIFQNAEYVKSVKTIIIDLAEKEENNLEKEKRKDEMEKRKDEMEKRKDEMEKMEMEKRKDEMEKKEMEKRKDEMERHVNATMIGFNDERFKKKPIFNVIKNMFSNNNGYNKLKEE